MAYTPEQLARYREQIRRTKELIGQGMSEADAEMAAAKQMLAEQRAVTAGNGAEIDNLAGAATPVAIEPTVGRVAPPQEDRVFADDPTGGNASILAARAQADAERAAWYNSPEGPGGSAAADTAKWYQTFGDARTPQSRAAMTPVQQAARAMQRENEDNLRNHEDYVGLEVQRLADRTGKTERAILEEFGPIDLSGRSDAARAVAMQQREAARAMLQAEARDLRRADLAQRRQEASRRAMAQVNPLAYAGRQDITEAQRDAVLARYPGGSRFADDPRVRVADINAKAAADQVAAEREARISQQQWLEQTRLAAEERAAKLADDRAAATRQFDAEQKRLDRQLKSGETAATLENAAGARADALEADRLKHQEAMQRMAEQSKDADRRHAEVLRQLANQYGMAETKMEREKQRIDDALKLAERNQLLQSMEEKYGPGVRAIADGDYGLPDAQNTLQRMAADSDKAWLGFWEEDGRRMDGILERLGVADPAKRRELVEQFGYGLENDFFGAGGDGRGGVLSYLFSGRY